MLETLLKLIHCAFIAEARDMTKRGLSASVKVIFTNSYFKVLVEFFIDQAQFFLLVL